MFDVDPECCTSFRFEELILLQAVIGGELPVPDDVLFQAQPRLKKESLIRYISDPCILYKLLCCEKFRVEHTPPTFPPALIISFRQLRIHIEIPKQLKIPLTDHIRQKTVSEHELIICLPHSLIFNHRLAIPASNK